MRAFQSGHRHVLRPNSLFASDGVYSLDEFRPHCCEVWRRYRRPNTSLHEHCRAMTFAQITYRESLRDIEACLGSQPSKLYGMGLRGPVAKCTLADANELRDWRIWCDLA